MRVGFVIVSMMCLTVMAHADECTPALEAYLSELNALLADKRVAHAKREQALNKITAIKLNRKSMSDCKIRSNILWRDGRHKIVMPKQSPKVLK